MTVICCYFVRESYTIWDFSWIISLTLKQPPSSFKWRPSIKLNKHQGRLLKKTQCFQINSPVYCTTSFILEAWKLSFGRNCKVLKVMDWSFQKLTVAISKCSTFWKNWGMQIRMVYTPQSAVKFATMVAHTGSEAKSFSQGTGGA